MYSTSIKSLSGKAWIFPLLSLFLLLSEGVNGQILQTNRFEIPSSGNNDFEVVPARNSIYLCKHFNIGREDVVHVVNLDTTLQEKWGGFITLEKNYVLMGKKSFEDKLYLLFRYFNYSRNNFILFVIDSTGKYTQHPVKGYIPFSPSEFEITNNAVLIGGYFNHVPLVLYFSLLDATSKVLPGLFNENGELTHVKTYDDGSFDILISSMNFQRRRTLWVKSYFPDGSLRNNIALDPGPDKNLIFGRTLKSENGNLIAGVYGSRTGEYSNGIFVAQTNDEGISDIQYYNFADLDNFFKYMKAKREKRVKERIERRKIKGKRVRLHYRFLVHELAIHNGQYIFLGEAFYPKYVNADPTGYGFSTFRGGMMSQGRVFDGYYYTHAVVIGFTPSGNLVWDNSFEINDVKTFKLEQFVKLISKKDDIALMYTFDNEIRSKIIRDNTVLEGKTSSAITTGLKDEYIRRDSRETSHLAYWYGDYMIAYGNQEIEKVNGKGGRRVFFINKLKPVEDSGM